MNNYKLKITTLSPVHIGTGEVYEPTNYVIDNGYLYEFDETLFLKHLPSGGKNKFIELSNLQSSYGNELFEKIHAFILQNKEYAIDVSINKVRVSNYFENKYKRDIARKVQIEGKNNTSIFNKFEIQKTQREANKVTTFIAGSSLKGSISTAYQEMYFKTGGKLKLKEFEDTKPFKNLVISDTLAQKATSEISLAINQELFEDGDADISTMIEVNLKDSYYLTTLSIRDYLDDNKQEFNDKITKQKIIDACNSHYKIIYEDKEKGINLQKNQFLLSVGKHSGARAVTIDGLRKILVKLAQIQNKGNEDDNADARIERLRKKSFFEPNKIKSLFADEKLLSDKEKIDFENATHFIEDPAKLECLVKKKDRFTINAILTQETTVWKFPESNGDSFGWLLCEFIDDNEYNRLFSEFKSYEEDFVRKTREKQKKIKDQIQQDKESKRNAALKKQQEQEAEEKAKKEAQRLRQDQLSKMSPFELKVEDLRKVHPDKNARNSVIVFQALKEGLMDNFKCEAVGYVKEQMIKENTWNKPAKKDAYKRTQKIIGMLNDC